MLYKLLEGASLGRLACHPFSRNSSKFLEVSLTNLQNGSIIKAMSSFANRPTLDLPDDDKIRLLPPKFLVLGDEVSKNQLDEYGASVQAVGGLGETVYIGRAEHNDIVVKGDPYASRLHCRIRCLNNKYYLKDLGSTNGTYEEGTKMIEDDEIRLQHGDLIEIGTSRYVMLDIGKLAPQKEKFRLVKRFESGLAN